MTFWRHDSLLSIESPRGLMQNTYLATKNLTAAKSKQTWLRPCKVKVISGTTDRWRLWYCVSFCGNEYFKGKKTETTTTTKKQQNKQKNKQKTMLLQFRLIKVSNLNLCPLK